MTQAQADMLRGGLRNRQGAAARQIGPRPSGWSTDDRAGKEKQAVLAGMKRGLCGKKPIVTLLRTVPQVRWFRMMIASAPTAALICPLEPRPEEQP